MALPGWPPPPTLTTLALAHSGTPQILNAASKGLTELKRRAENNSSDLGNKGLAPVPDSDLAAHHMLAGSPSEIVAMAARGWLTPPSDLDGSREQMDSELHNATTRLAVVDDMVDILLVQASGGGSISSSLGSMLIFIIKR